MAARSGVIGRRKMTPGNIGIGLLKMGMGRGRNGISINIGKRRRVSGGSGQRGRRRVGGIRIRIGKGTMGWQL